MTSPNAAIRYLTKAIKEIVTREYAKRTGLKIYVDQMDEAHRIEGCDEELIISPPCGAFALRIRIDSVSNQYLNDKLSDEEREYWTKVVKEKEDEAFEKLVDIIINDPERFFKND